MPITKIDGKKKNGKQGYRVRVNFTDAYGKARQVERTVYGIEEAKETEWQLSLSCKETTPSAITVEALSVRYFAAQKHEVRESTLAKNQCIYETHILPFLGKNRIDKLNVTLLEDWKTAINEKGLSFTMRKNIYSVLRAMLNYAVRIDLLPKNPLHRVGNFKDAYEKKEALQYYTAEQFQKFIAAAYADAQETGDMRYYAFFSTLFYTGARKGEANALDWTDLDGDILHIGKNIVQKLEGDDRITPPKNKSSDRTLQVPLPLLAVFEEQRKWQKKNGVYSKHAKICGGLHALRDTSIEKKNKQYAEKAGLPKIRIHDFRHSHASLLANEGINIQEIARRLGHSKIEMTWNTYSHLYPREEERAVALLNQIPLPKNNEAR
ncbi:MAG: site-specific integrase [Ruminococcaceae bacterium]|nr:site-specific integrase [Oscillospiraceae bacterium]